jgi:hypothetical protein
VSEIHFCHGKSLLCRWICSCLFSGFLLPLGLVVIQAIPIVLFACRAPLCIDHGLVFLLGWISGAVNFLHGTPALFRCFLLRFACPAIFLMDSFFSHRFCVDQRFSHSVLHARSDNRAAGSSIFSPLSLVILCPPAYAFWSPPPLCSGSHVHPVSTGCAAFSLVFPSLKSGAEACSCAESFGHHLSVLVLKLPVSSFSWQVRATKAISFPVKLPATARF